MFSAKEMDGDCQYCLHNLITKNSYNEGLNTRIYGLTVTYNSCTHSISRSQLAEGNSSSKGGARNLLSGS